MFHNQKSIFPAVLLGVFTVLICRGINLFSLIGLCMFYKVAIDLYTSFGKILPIRLLFLFFMCFQLLFCSYLAYNVFPGYQYYPMKVDQDVYFSYTVPAIFCFSLGLYFREKYNKNLELLNLSDIAILVHYNRVYCYLLIAMGVAASFISGFFPNSFAFVFYVLGLLKFVGLFVLILSNSKLNGWLLLLIYGSILISSFQNAMFHDLLVWLLFLLALFAVKYRISHQTRSIFLLSFVLLVLFIQVIKSTYRDQISRLGNGSVETVIASVDMVKRSSGTGLFSIETLAPQLSRFNQGWIVASILDNVPRNVPFADGETISLYIKAAFLPRIWDENKLRSGDKDLFNKYSGWQINKNTSMSLSSVGDAYINYGKFGGWVFMFLYGLMFSLSMNFLSKKSVNYPLLPIFSLILFAYPIRIEADLQTILGHFVKSSIIVYVLFLVGNKRLKKFPAISSKKIQ